MSFPVFLQKESFCLCLRQNRVKISNRLVTRIKGGFSAIVLVFFFCSLSMSSSFNKDFHVQGKCTGHPVQGSLSPNNHSQTDEGSQINANLQMHKYYQQVAMIPSCACIAIFQQLDQFL